MTSKIKGHYKESYRYPLTDESQTVSHLFSIGGNYNWYYAPFLWRIRGFFDRLIGGKGFQLTSKNLAETTIGDQVDFWKVLRMDYLNRSICLKAEMKLPGRALVSFNVENGYLYQNVIFQVYTLWGRIYWLLAKPFHKWIFYGLGKKIAH